MARKIKRHAQLIGDYSYYVSLPKHWVLDNRIDEDPTVFIELKNRKTLIVTPAKEGQKRD
ncbi:MAG: hypothetical protein M1496_04435 [Candidatus Thermoplasmatota archaeon]|nr:hypothetical protein [Candidatus Thermoplasmatota archaeon]